MEDRLYYLASPYSHKDPEIMKERAEVATKAAVDLLKMGVFTFAPIPYNCHWEKYNVPGDWGFWEAFDKTFVRRCDAIIVLMIDGWDRSVGVNAEIEFARSIGKPVYFLTLEQIENRDILHITNPGHKDLRVDFGGKL